MASLLIGSIIIILLSLIRLDEALAMGRVETFYCPSLLFRRVVEAAVMLWMITLVVNYAVLSRRNRHLTAIAVESAILGAVFHYAWLLGMESCTGSVKMRIEVTILPLVYYVKTGEEYATAFIDIGQLMVLYSVFEIVRGIVPRTVSQIRRIRAPGRTTS